MGTLQYLPHCLAFLCLSVAGANRAQQRDSVLGAASWAPGTGKAPLLWHLSLGSMQHPFSQGLCALDYLAKCDFNNNSQPFCDWTQTCGTSQGTWIRTKHATPTLGTGPEGDYPDGRGYFIYQEASNLVPFDTNRLESPELVVSGGICVDFWYHMLGLEDRNELNVIVLEETGESLVWSRRGNQSSAWLYGFTSVYFQRETHMKVAFEAVRGLTEYGDTAVDNVAVRRGPCTGSGSTSTPSASTSPTELPVGAPSTLPTVATTPYLSTPESGPPTTCDFSCSFDVDFCSWTQSDSDSFDWTRQKGPTPSSTTGPSYDHTTGGGYYIYLKGTDANPGDVAHLVSPTCTSHGPHCFRFWYHMYGVARTMALRVYVVPSGSAPILLWSQMGNQGDRWRKAEVSVPHRGRVQILLEGVRGEDFRSDIAVDDISFTSGCSETTPPGTTTTTTPTTSTPAPITSTSAPITLGYCTVSGDPHYYTFDKQTHHFMGNCTYTLSRLCDQNASLPYFNVEAANEYRWGNTRVSYVQSVAVDVHGVRILLEKEGAVQVNGKREVVPSTPIHGVQISSSGFYTVVSTDFGLRVKFDGDHQVEVTLPSPYKGRVCGLCGNYNGNPRDDFLNPGGELEPDSTSLGNSWQVSNLTSCSSGTGSDPACTEDEKQVAQSSTFCGLITDAAGPFRHCHGTLDPVAHFSSCIYDQCELHLDRDSLCKSLQSYADACRSLGIRVESWRNETFCPISCPPNSHYESCAIACPATCVEPTAPSTCSLPCVEGCACDSGFLLNNGKCVPSRLCGCWHEGKHYPVLSEFWTDDTCSSKCKCPSRGSNLECFSASCPKNTFCGIQNGVPGCYPETFGICRVHNDPHYNTFDKVTHHFMGTCTYTLAKVCANSTRLPYFNIEAKNENRGNPSVSYVQRVLVEVYGQHIEILKNRPSHILVNKLWTTLPVSTANGSVAVSRSGRYVILETDFRLTVSYDTDHSVEIRVPTTYANLTCGMCGNFNARRQDDYMMPDGRQAKNSNELGKSWKIVGAEYDDPYCDSPETEPPCTTQQEDVYKTDAFCGLLTSTEAPFAACHTVINPESFFESCVFDLCALHGSHQTLCSALGTYADACQRAGVTLPSWRNATFCPIPCPSNSYYNSCASACPATCSNPLAPKNCSKPCVEDCECREGFVLSGGDCVSVADCGCLVEDKYYEKGETFWIQDCLGRCRCTGNGNLICGNETCPPEQICKVQNGIQSCYPPNTAHCHIYGDPHYITFDGKLYHFQGGCNYTAVETCANSSQHFSVTTRNEYRWSAAWTALNSVAVSFQNLHIALRKSREVYVNGVRVSIPVSLHLGTVVEERPPYVVVRSPLGLLVKFDGDQELFVQVDERHKGHLCGLCGTYSGSQLDDFRRPDGTLEHDPNAFGNSWRVMDDHWTCDPPGPAPPPCNSTQERVFQELCKVILSSTGPFAACHWNIPPQLYFESCVYDQCAMEGHNGQLCKSLGAYAAACELGGVNLGDWWKDTTCAASNSTSTPTPSTEPTKLPVEEVTPPGTTTTTTPTTSTPAPITSTSAPITLAPSSTSTGTSMPFISTPWPGPPTTCDFSCSFDVDFCSWTQSDSDSFDWTRQKGPTPSSTTGPSYDHTTGGGYYIYLKGTDANPGDVAHLVSPTCTSHGPHCFRFWYHMYGVARTMALRVYVVSSGSAPILIWSQMGNQGDRWRKAEVSVPHRGRVQILLEGVRGEDFRSDIAVDDISFTSGCSEATPPGTTTTTTPTTSTPAPITSTSAPITLGYCTVSGDPHYYTFDKQTHHFMGNCTYTLSRLCDQNTSLPYFNVEAANEYRWGNTRVSYVQSVAVDVHGMRILLEKGGAVQVNGKRKVVPSTPIHGVQISSSGFYTVVSTDFGLRVKFDGDHQVEVTLPSPYKGRVCGLCGNYNGNPRDDFLNPGGELEPDSTSLGNSWQVSNLTSCSSGTGSDPACTEDEKQVAQSSTFCGLITDAAGPFRHCHGTLDPVTHFSSCIYDQCELHLDRDSLCKSLQSYADACRSLGVRVESWRNETFCPISCPPNSHYESCAIACPATCVEPTAPSTCSLPCVEGCACDSGFLLNNGKCVPSRLCGCWHEGKHYPLGSEFWTDDTCSFKCKCPSRGSNLECFRASCPKNTFCGIQNGVPGCYLETFGICRVHNDPHYNTFDKVTHHFMGTCTYTLAKVCANSTRLPYFNIEAKNENRGNPSVSYVQRVLVEVYGQHIEILKNRPSHILVNKLWTTLPVSTANGSVAVSRSGRYVILETDFRLTVSYDTDHSVEIRVPTTYTNLTCGMCGNFNARRQDDYMMPDGRQAKNSNELGKSWKIADAEYDDPYCDSPETVPPCTTQQEDVYKTDAFCGLLTSTEAPFAACHTVINPESFFESCVFDLCALHGSHQTLCSALGTYADACQRAGVTLPSWRNATFCPIPCPSNSYYNSCASACPATCSNPLAPKNCSKPCVEDCECREGFVLSGGDCVSVADCGCLVEDKYYEKGETFWIQDCLGRCRCAGNGNLICGNETCPPEQICKVQNGIQSCYPPNTAHCHIYGDPHYITFDGKLYHFQGGCNYTAVETCANSSQHFSVTTRNEYRWSAAWTALNSVAVSFQNLHIDLRKNREVYVNGVRVSIPVSLHLGTVVEERPPYVVVRSPLGLLVKFDGDQELFVQVDERHKGHLCGLCGTYSGSQLDDFRRPDGTLEHDPNAFGNSWRVMDDHWTCDPPGPAPPPCNSTQELVFQELCKVILSSTGPFAACHWNIPPQLYFESCVYDQCAMEGHNGQLCKSLGAYAAACELGGVNLGDWWKDTTCAASSSTSTPTPSTEPTKLPVEAPSSTSTGTSMPFISTPWPGPPTTCDFSCSFDVDFCSWTQSDSDSFDWTRQKGPTPSSTTGPSYDHTTGGGYYIYLKGTDANPGDVAHLVSPTCISHGPHCFRFWYHMYGVARTMALRVYVVSSGSAPILIWSQMGNQGDRWRKAEVSVPHRGRVQILLEGVRGEDFRSDIAVDDISFTSGCSEATPPGTTATTTPTTSTPAPITSTSAPITLGYCTVSGDPHYYTFDKQTHHFMGNCTYTLSRLCDQNASLPYFNVEAANEYRWGNTRVSYVQSVAVDVHGVRILLEKGGAVQVNGKREVVPSTPIHGVQISSSGFYTVVSTDFGLRVKFDGDHQVEVTLPSPYKGRVCGLCGNYNGNPRDDFLNPGGELEPDSTSLGNSWQVSNLTSCSSGTGSDPACTEDEKQVAQSGTFCGLITDAAGPFRHCHGTLDPVTHFSSCIYDQCELHLDRDSLCKSLQSYADACRSLGVRVESWRNETFCPISCPPNSHYESCAIACPATCVEPTAPSTCSLPCVEGCACDSGFLLNNGKCVPSRLCGCWHEGKHYPLGSEFWTDDTCSFKCKCPSRGSNLECFRASCPQNTFCGIQNGVPGCYLETFGICRVHNDPHYNTFDKVTHHFMGTCTYTLAKVCANSTRLPYFNIEAKNENRGNPSVSYVQRVLVEVYGQHIEILKNRPSHILVNKLWTTLPVSTANGSVAVSRSGRYVILETDFRLTVSYDTDHSVEIRVPTTYTNLTCGMCGNFNARRQDDYMMPDGRQAKNSNELGKSWKIADAEYDDLYCDSPETVPPCTTQQEDVYKTDAFCGLLMSTEAPFAACHAVINPESFFESCVFDLCALHGSHQTLCSALGTYADACQRAGVTLPSWRNATFCPIPCPSNSYYNSCASACPATCSNALAPKNCSKPCVEDCECREGFVLSGGDCVSVADCGCLVEDKYYEKGETFWIQDCLGRCRCAGNGNLICGNETCPPEQICKVQNGIQSCYPPNTAHCHIYGDPHYITFDGKLYHFQGGCNYTAVETCANSSQHFSVTTRNEYRWSAAWTALNSVAVSFKNLHIDLRKNREVYVNGVRVSIPVSLHLGTVVEERPPYVVVRSPLGLLVKFDGDQELFVQVDERHKGHLCGLCGTYSGSQLDDFRRPDGTLEHDPNAFGNSWRVMDDHWTCDPPGPAPPPCNSTQELVFQELCKVILSSTGPFAACHWNIPPQLYFESCVYDQCAMEGHNGQLCKSLGAYAAACELGGVNLGDWWKDTTCAASSSTSTPTPSTEPTKLPVEEVTPPGTTTTTTPTTSRLAPITSTSAPITLGYCTVSGDPHYYTFDKQTHHFMGNCTYTLSRLCDQNASLPYFNVEAANEYRWGNTRVSYVQSVAVDVHGVRILLEKGGAVQVNGKREVVPSTPIHGVQISSSGFYTVVSTDFGLRVKFDGDHQVEVTLPSPYKGRVCGLCGNYNGNPRDDFLNPDGELEPDSTSLGNSWQVSNLTSCSSGTGSDPACTEDEKQVAQSSTFCGLITDAAGPFRHCHGTLDPVTHFSSCIYDQCELHLDRDSLCKSLQSYADACRSLGVRIESWRNESFCPISCPPNSHYESCAIACPATCVEPTAPSTCSLPCVEGCACDSGFLLNNGKCVPSRLCGCWHEGKHYPVGSEFWTDDTCSSKCKCPSRGSNLKCFSASCPKNTFCGIQNGVPGCYPETFGICRVHNDPHYNTFDKVTHHFMGTCTYTLAKVCANSTRLPYFNIEAKNENRGNPSVSYVQRVLVEVYGQHIEILKNRPSHILVNKLWTTLPVSTANGSVAVSRSGRYVILETDFRLTVSYDTDHSVEIRVPTTYANLTCGMCGNFNTRRQDDYMMPDGRQAKNSNELGKSWKIADAEYDDSYCDSPETVPLCTPQQEDVYKTDAFCGLLTSTEAPFAACHAVINPESFFESCVFDLCALHGSHQTLCSALGTYADACQRAGVTLPSWRNATFCPIPCPSNSYYNSCASACPGTCSNPLAPKNCSKPCVEDCECREGFVLSGGDCVSVADCGCLVEDKYYEKGETFWIQDCLGRCRCAGNGNLICGNETCPPEQICKVQNGIQSCYPPNTAHCHIYGDPHYITFDGKLYHFQGGCNYTAVKTCANSSQHFSVTTRNEYRWSAAWTALNSVAVSFQNLHIALRKNREVYVNGVKVSIPVSLHLGIVVEEKPPYVVVRSPFGLLVKFDGDQELFVQVDERHKGHLCGLCGTFSGSQLDDFRRPDGILEHDPNAFGNSWRVTDYHWTCDPPGPAPPPCNSTQELVFQELCKVILSSTGPFAACHWNIPPQLYFESCVYDQCAMEGHNGQLCKSLGAYAAACELGGVNLGDWWKDTTCAASSSTSIPATSTDPTRIPATEFCFFNCSFEEDFCEWRQSVTDDSDWIRRKHCNLTVSAGVVNPCNASGGYYISTNNHFTGIEKTTQLISPECKAQTPLCFRFWYRLAGASEEDALKVYLLQEGEPNALLVWLASGSPRDSWLQAEVDLHIAGRFQILLEGVTGSRNGTEVAVDEASVAPGCCLGDVPIPSEPSPTGDTTGETVPTSASATVKASTVGTVTVTDETTGEMIASSTTPGLEDSLPTAVPTTGDCSFNCSFDDDFCEWQQSRQDDFGWSRKRHPASSRYYIYADSPFNQVGQTGQLISPNCTTQTPLCFRFWYRLAGASEEDALKVYLLQEGEPNALLVWLASGSLRDSWLQAEVDLHIAGRFQILLEGVTGTGNRTEVAVDEASVAPGCCLGDVPVPSKPSPTGWTTDQETSPVLESTPPPETTAPPEASSVGQTPSQGTTPELGSAPPPETTSLPEATTAKTEAPTDHSLPPSSEHPVSSSPTTSTSWASSTLPVTSRSPPPLIGRATCSASGDPHYTTFDGRVHHFMGICTYTLAQDCRGATGLPASFHVSATNELRGTAKHVSYVNSVHVEAHGSRISLLKNRNVNVNGTRRNLPVSIGDRKITVYISGGHVRLETDFGLGVKFDGNHYVEVSVPPAYKGQLCGLCGNYNQNPADDNLKPDGQPAADSTILGDSWLVPGNISESCSSLPTPECDPETEKEIRRSSACNMITDPSGVFQGCHRVLDPAPFFENCIYDVCLTGGQLTSLCYGLQAYAEACANAGMCLEWRNATLCPITCPAGSQYKSCGNQCPSSCAMPSVLGSCSPLPVEGCFCDEGFVLSGDRCVPEDSCGCVDSQGYYYQLGESWFTNGACSERCTCEHGRSITCGRWECGVQEKCDAQDGVLGCHPKDRASCQVVGDPHYYTFDKVMHTFLGTCTYTLATLCNDGGGGSTPFTVSGRNEDRGQRGATYLREVYVDVYGTRVTLQKNKRVLLNNERVYTPVGSRSRGNVAVGNVGNFIVVETDFGLVVKYDGNLYLEISLPSSYFAKVCGLCGNYNGQTEDEWLMPNGLQARNDTQLGNSWKVANDSEVGCLPDTREDLDPPCTPQERPAIEEQCHVLQSSIFAPCHSLVKPKLFVQTCVYDMCKYDGMKSTLCAIAQAYADACKAEGVLLSWRNATFCPLPCPSNSYYTNCASPCPPTCNNIYAEAVCEKPQGECLEGCACKEGYILSDGQCVPLSECGCRDKNNAYHKVGESWITPHCSQKCRCYSGGIMECQNYGCEVGEICQLKNNGKYTCKPTGFGKCLITGDPHYLTFDGLLHHFQGQHTYVVAARRPGAAARLEHFSIEGTNKARAGSSGITFLKELLITVYNHTVLFSQGKMLVLDGVQTVPPAQPHEGLRLQQRATRIYMETDFGLSVTFDGAENSDITLPNPYKKNVEGLCGNFDGKYKNDFTTPDGTVVKDVNTFGESWRVPVVRGGARIRRDAVSEQELDDAELDVGFTPRCSPSELKEVNSSSHCGILADPEGPFQACFPHVSLEPFLLICLYDMCMEADRAAALCRNLEQYMLACQEEGIAVGNWRENTSCALPCPRNSQYSACAPVCPPSCSDLAAPAECSGPCLEGCECLPGYVFSGFECVPFSECGCTFQERYYKAGESFMTEDCRQFCTCTDSSSIHCSVVTCAPSELCMPVNATRGCYRASPCLPNPCLNGGTCEEAAGPSGFSCSCPKSHQGSFCETENVPPASPCLPNPCLNGGTCEEAGGPSGFSCSCPESHQGSFCENEKVPPDVHPPENTSGYIIAGVVSGLVVLALIFGLVLYSQCSRKRAGGEGQSLNPSSPSAHVQEDPVSVTNVAFEKD
ncbi:IgGFc-binding protein-like [Eublepharis macularius]|uniref:IgGFc-binding protein-like n=1 Tax=Eublepharis macularius TaxID=481883 RepID=A0AA97JH24_EUBMA|nr:IgGFc-binding protein-like [Eublepharis macularius]